MAPNLHVDKGKQSIELDKINEAPKYLEILGDTVLPRNIILAIIISIILSLSGYLLGERLFPLFASEKMVSSYSLLLGIGGSVLSLALCAFIFNPSRVLTEEETSLESMEEIFKDMQLDPKEEYLLIEEDPVTRKEMEALGVLDKFRTIGEDDKK
ncbi:hypothetical protein MKX83_03615 [Cytobacillus sp. FSL M8-0252]|uniref:hypothetical protein n=1 Tax=Cytobacillus sp. FSL M8-0252 TaxID=2921621 RepID=UPI0030F4C866